MLDVHQHVFLDKSSCDKFHIRGTDLLALPKGNSTKHGLRSFRYFAVQTWNVLPEAAKAMAGTRQFLKRIRHTGF